MNAAVLIKYYPVVIEVVQRLIPLIKGSKRDENTEKLEMALRTLEHGMRETETWILKREREIVILRWTVVFFGVVAIANTVVLAVKFL